jgi:DNA-binding transcriptional ArsR family regulator
MLELLRGGPATATMLAREVGESSGATSYHLRELEKAGFVEEDRDRGNARDRWWRRTTPFFLVPVQPAADVEYDAALGQLRSIIVRRDEEALGRFFTTFTEEVGEWREASFVGGWLVHATADEIRAFTQLVLAEMDKLRRPVAERPEGAREVYITFRTLAQPER